MMFKVIFATGILVALFFGCRSSECETITKEVVIGMRLDDARDILSETELEKMDSGSFTHTYTDAKMLFEEGAKYYQYEKYSFPKTIGLDEIDIVYDDNGNIVLLNLILIMRSCPTERGFQEKHLPISSLQVRNSSVIFKIEENSK